MIRKSSDEYAENARKNINYLVDTFCEGKKVIFCEKTGLSKGSVSQYCNGNNIPNNKTAKIIADAFNVSPVWVMGLSTSMHEQSDTSHEDPGIVVTDKDNRFSIHFRDGKTMSDEDKELLKEQLENTIDIFYKLRGIDKK